MAETMENVEGHLQTLNDHMKKLIELQPSKLQINPAKCKVIPRGGDSVVQRGLFPLPSTSLAHPLAGYSILQYSGGGEGWFVGLAAEQWR